MIDEATEELASLYALGALAPEEAAAFEARLAADEELAALVFRLQAAAGALARTVPPADPPPALRTRLLGEIRPAAVTPAPPLSTSGRWVIAASVAVLIGLVLLQSRSLERESAAIVAHAKAEQTQEAALKARIAAIQSSKLVTESLLTTARQEAEALRQELEASRQQVASLQAQDNLAQIKIAMLTATGQKMPKALAIVAWDADRQHGMLKPMHMPPASPGQDYQLWVIDPAHAQPISAGVFEGGEGPSTEFKPVQPIAQAAKFAISVEKKGGAPAPSGPVVLISE